MPVSNSHTLQLVILSEIIMGLVELIFKGTLKVKVLIKLN